MEEGVGGRERMEARLRDGAPWKLRVSRPTVALVERTDPVLSRMMSPSIAIVSDHPSGYVSQNCRVWSRGLPLATQPHKVT